MRGTGDLGNFWLKRRPLGDFFGQKSDLGDFWLKETLRRSFWTKVSMETQVSFRRPSCEPCVHKQTKKQL